MKLTIRTLAIVFTLIVSVLFAFLGTGISSTYAVLPVGYDAAVQGEDWYFGEDFLDIATLKHSVDTWKQNDRTYDFDSLEKDPIVIAVIDTGVKYLHELFQGYYDEDGNPVADTEDVGEYDVFLRNEAGEIVCKNTVKESAYISNSIIDDAPDKHGTHVAGIVATLIHALDLEKYIKILPIKAAYPKSKNSSFSVEAVQDALEFAINNGADVINMSLSSTSVSYGTLVTNEIADKAVVVAAAGNESKASEGGISPTKYYPAASGNVIGVMNLQRDGDIYKVYSSSNYGNAYDLGAPGYAIWSVNGETDDGYKKLNGTSMASPIVAFGAALATLKYRAIANATGAEDKTAREIALTVRSAHTRTVLHKLKIINVFDLNALAKEDGIYSLYITCDDSSLKQELGKVHGIDFSASLLPVTDENEELAQDICWYVSKDGGERAEFAKGKSCVYTPDNALGEYTVIAEYTGIEQTFRAEKIVTVEYVAPSEQDTKIDDSDVPSECEIGEEYEFEIKNREDFDPTDTVIWYVNGEYAGNGWTFKFAPNAAGEYVITAKINGIVLDDAVTIIVSEESKEEQKNSVYAYTSIGVGGGVILVGCIACIVYAVLKKKF